MLFVDAQQVNSLHRLYITKGVKKGNDKSTYKPPTSILW